MESFKTRIGVDQDRDTGMAVVLLLLLLDIKMRRNGVLVAAAALHILNMIVPQVYRPVAVVWFGFARLLSIVSSKILMTILFFGVVTPVGLLRRLFGKDPLGLHAFKAGQDTVMLERNHRFCGRDMERPY